MKAIQLRYAELHDQVTASRVNNVTIPIVVQGTDYDREIFCEALRLLINRHDLLRCVVAEKGKESWQFKYSSWNMPLEEVMPSGSDEIRTWDEIVKEEAKEAFCRHLSINIAPMLCVKVVLKSSNCFAIIVSVNHIICDGYSLRLLVKDLLKFYELLQKNTFTMAALPVVARQVSRSDPVVSQDSFHWWTKYLASDSLVDVRPTPIFFKPMGKVSLDFPFEFHQAFMKKIKARKVSATAVLAAVHALAERELVSASTVLMKIIISQRSPADTYCVNNLIDLLILRITTERVVTFDEEVASVHTQLSSARKHYIPHWTLVKTLFPDKYLNPYGLSSFENNIYQAESDILYECDKFTATRMASAAQNVLRWPQFKRGLLLRPKLVGASSIEMFYDTALDFAVENASEILSNCHRRLISWVYANTEDLS